MANQRFSKTVCLSAVTALSLGCMCEPELCEPGGGLGGLPQIAPGMNVRVAMPDGAELLTDIYAPAGPGPWPAVLVRQPYDRKDAVQTQRGADLSAAGIVCVVQNSRGHYGSQGNVDFFDGDKQDGRDMLRIIRAQSWCTGRVAMIGHSAPGIAAYLALPNNTDNPDEFVCSWIEMATPDLQASVYQGGVFRKALCEQWLSGTGQDALLGDVVANATNRAWWDTRRISSEYANIRSPVMHLTGWFDIFTKNQIDAFMGAQAAGAPEQHLIIGPWSHDGVDAQQQGQLTFPQNADLQTWQLRDEWLTFYLLGPGNVGNWPTVRYYRMGDVDDPNAPGNDWQTATTWPPFANTQTFYLRPGGLLDPSAPTANEAPDQFTYNPDLPAPTVGGNNLFLDQGPHDQSAVESRADVLTYTAAALTAPLEVTGRVQARVFLESSGLDTDLLVRLCDVYPDGRSMPVAENIIRARFRDSNGPADGTLLVPGQTHEINLDLWDTSIVFNMGHSIRVSVTSSSDSRFDPNPNTDDAFRASTNSVVVTNTIHHDAARPSAITFPTP